MQLCRLVTTNRLYGNIRSSIAGAAASGKFSSQASLERRTQNRRKKLQMPTLNRPDGAKIDYEVKGNGPNHVLLLGRGGMSSSRYMWNKSSYYNPWMDTSLAADFTLIGVDQRLSRHGKLSDDHDIGWETFRDDQIALLDHLNVEKCHILGSCIGPSYGLALLRDYPDRFERAVLIRNMNIVPRKKWFSRSAYNY